jgi:2,5-diketo-D-gluconate reductase A
VTQSWSPLGGAGSGLLEEGTITSIAEAHGRTAGQIVLRWHIQNDLVPLPKSASPSRQADNLAVFDFDLTPEDMAAIDALSKGPNAGVDSDISGH